MDIRDIQNKLKDLGDRLPQERGDKIKVIVVATLLPVLVIWLIYYVATSMIPAPTAQVLDTPAWKTALALEQSLNAEKLFKDVGFAVVTEEPLRFIVRGAVYADRDLPALMAKLKELRPEGDYDVQVEVLKVQPQ